MEGKQMIEQKRNPAIFQVPLHGKDSESLFDPQRRAHHHYDLGEDMCRI
jgi:hypothetical protein